MIFLYSGLAVILFILLAGIFSSCAVVKTNYAADTKKEATIFYYLPETLLKIHSVVKVAAVYNNDDSSLNASSSVIEQSFTVTPEMIADTKNLLTLNYKPGVFSADDLKLSVNSKGLLETVNAVSEDRTADIIAALAAAPQTILSAAPGAARGAGLIVKIKEYASDFVIKVADLSAEKKNVSWNIVVVNELSGNGYINVRADFTVNTMVAIAASRNLPDFFTGDKKTSGSETDGILSRPLSLIQLNIESADESLSKGLPFPVAVADMSKLVTVPVNRTAFVERTNKIGFTDGLLVSNEINKPSSVEGFVSIPVNVAKAVVSIPGQLITFKIDNTKRLTELENQKLSLEKAIQENQKFELTKQQEIEKIKLEIQKSSLAVTTELEKTKLDLEKSLLDSKLELLKTKQALDELKKKLEELATKK